VLDPKKFSRKYDATITKLDDHSLLFTGDNIYRDEYDLTYEAPLKKITALKIEVLPHPDLPKGGPGRNPSGGFALTELTVMAAPIDGSKEAIDVALQNPSADASPETVAQAIDGKADLHWKVGAGQHKAATAVFQFKEPLTLDEGATLSLKILSNFFSAEGPGRIRVSATSDDKAVASGAPAGIEQILLTPAEQRTPEQLAAIKKQFLLTTPVLAAQHAKIEALRTSEPQQPTTLVMRERTRPRVTQIHHRGEYLQPSEPVEPNVPAVLHPLPPNIRRDRLALARWLVDPENPLVARVTMNRMWMQYFGRGIVATVDDVGTMGDRPSHPELLDWLATELVRQNWSLKTMHRLIVTSATYRQSSVVTPNLLEKDPSNILLARAPRLRVEGEIVRDIALCAAGLMNDRIGGPSVFPPQPPDISERAYGPFPWPTSTGPDRYRRGMYTYLKRTTPYPALITFDGSSAETTCTRRIRSNTPLQALTTLNDIVYTEAAQAMAKRVIDDRDGEADRACYAMRLCVGRNPQPSEVERLVAFYKVELEHFHGQADPKEVALAPGAAAPKDVDLPELAAWTMVCRAVLNLDETMTKD
jgi:hypothetical protein